MCSVFKKWMKNLFTVRAQWPTHFEMTGFTSWNTLSHFLIPIYFGKEMQLLGFVDIRLTHMSRTTYREFNKKQLQFPAYKHVKKPTRRSGQWPYNSLVTFSFQANQIFLRGWNQTSKRMFQPSAAPVLICYLASSWLVIFCPQMEPSTSA